jgi:hypothetical protein
MVLALLLFSPIRLAWATPSTDVLSSISSAAMKLVQFCLDPKEGLNDRDVATLLEHVLGSKQERQYSLPKTSGAVGAYYEFDTKIAFPRYMEYNYNPLIPATVTRPSSVR